MGDVSADVTVSEISNRINKLELENGELKNLVQKLEARIADLEAGVRHLILNAINFYFLKIYKSIGKVNSSSS